jgi:hypothetical protein
MYRDFSDPFLRDQTFFDKFLVSNVFLTVYIGNFAPIYFDKYMCVEAGLCSFDFCLEFVKENLVVYKGLSSTWSTVGKRNLLKLSNDILVRKIRNLS